MDRRSFLNTGMGAAAAVGLAACTNSAISNDGSSEEASGTSDGTTAGDLAAEASGDSSLPQIDIEMATSWPLSLDTIFGGAVVFADRLKALSGGKFNITPRAGGDLVGGLEVLNAVSDGSVQAGHTASYYYLGQSPALAFGTALPFGLNDRQQNAWLFEGGGLEMLRELYAEKFGVIQFPAGNTGVQMGGWFNREINTVADLQGLSVRIPGLGGQVMTKLGATVQQIAGGEIFQALSTGAIDAAEWVGPYDDLQLGLQDAADFYYYPGWWEPGPTLEVQFSLDQWNSLPSLYQEMVQTAAHESNTIMMARYDAKNAPALAELQAGGTTVLPFSDEIMMAAETASLELFDESAASDGPFKEIYENWKPFRDEIQAWHSLAEKRMLDFGAKANA